MRVEKHFPDLNIKELSMIKVHVFVFKLLIWIGLIIVGGIGALYFEGILSLFFILIIALMFAHGVELQHQALHNTGFKSKFMNRLVGFFLGLPLFVSYSDYQYNHLRHHRLLGTPDNKEFFDYDTNKADTVWTIIPQLLMLNHFKDVMINMLYSLFGNIKMEGPKSVVTKTSSEYRLMLIILIACGLSMLVAPAEYLLKLWLLPLLLAVPIHALIELPEHVGCDKNDTNVLHNTRTIRANRFATWFTNGNNFHIEHHWLPGIPIENLWQLHSVVSSKEKFVEQSYREFYYKFFKQIIHNTFSYKN